MLTHQDSNVREALKALWAEADETGIDDITRYTRMLRLAEDKITVLKLSQAAIVAEIHRLKLWEKAGYLSLREYLRSTGLSESRVSILNFVGGTLVPFCDQHDIYVDSLLLPGQWGKLAEAIPALRRAIEGGDVASVCAILAFVKKAPNRTLVRARFRNKRSYIGQGMTVTLPDGRTVLVATLNDGLTPEVLVSKVGTILDLRHNDRGGMLSALGMALQVIAK